MAINLGMVIDEIMDYICNENARGNPNREIFCE